jgi:hypothetical protein
MNDPLPYVPIPTSDGDTVEGVLAAHGSLGGWIVYRTWQRIYFLAEPELDLSSSGFLKLHLQRCGCDEQQFFSVIESCLEFGTFDRVAWETRRVLTTPWLTKRLTKALHKRVVDAARQRKKYEKEMQSLTSDEAKPSRVRKPSIPNHTNQTTQNHPPQEVRLMKKGEERDAAETIGQVADPGLVKALVANMKRGNSEQDRPLTPEEIEAKKRLIRDQAERLEAEGKEDDTTG